MHLIQVLLPVVPDRRGSADARFAGVKSELTEKFGGVTVYRRAPAEGLWEAGGEVVRDEIVIIEVMANALERDWWHHFRKRLEREFEQELIVARSYEIDLL